MVGWGMPVAKRKPFLQWRPRSLQSRQLWAASLGLLAFLALAGYALDRAFVDTAERGARQRLQGFVLAYAAGIEFLRNGDIYVPDTAPDARFTRPGSGLYAEVVEDAALAESSDAWLRLKAAATAIQRLQARDGSIPAQTDAAADDAGAIDAAGIVVSGGR